MRKIAALLALLFVAGVPSAWAWNCQQVDNTTTTKNCTDTFFNDAGRTVVSGEVVIWDTDDTEFDRSGYPYITVTTTADNIHVAGIMETDTCLDQTLCNVIVWGWAPTRLVATTLTEDTMVATSTTSGSVGDYSPAANTCAVGRLLEYVDINTTGGCNGQICLAPVNVNISCQ